MALDLSLPASGNEPLTLDSARGSLLQPPEQPEKPASPTQAPAQETAPATEPDKPAAETPSGDETTEHATTEDTEPAEPAIEPPAFWKKSAKELFASLPRDVQEQIVERERERDTGTNRALQEAAEKRKAAEAELATATTERQTYQQRLNALVPGLQASIQNEFPEIKTPADVVTLAQADPARYAQWRAKLDAMQFAHAEQARLNDQKAKETEAQTRTAILDAERKLIETFPEWKDAERGRKEIAQLRDFLADQYGVPRQAVDGMMQPFEFQIAKDAMAYRRALKAKEQAALKSVPKVQQPGTSSSKADKAAEERAAKLKRLEQTGDIEDARGLLRQ